MPSPKQITVAQLARLIGTSTCPIIIDVSIDEDFDLDPYLIPTAKRYPHTKITDDVTALQGKKVIVVCQKGLKLSAGAAALLRSKGVDAESLEGGNYGWRDAGQPRIPAANIPFTSAGSTVWVCAHRPKIDRIACPWLIRRFVDPEASFLFVPPAEVEAVGEKFDATAFDTVGGFWSHRGEQCSFDTMIEEFELTTEPLLHLSHIVRAADTDRLDVVPEAAGLLAASLGLSRIYRDDLEQLEAGLLLYDAFYRWARDARKEEHIWQDGTSKGSPKKTTPIDHRE
ncbi:MAG: rhodanese-related sulfurtransferase [Candidatus Endobugula sp.]|jgi:rhodanese-related sulfurtransferase